MKHANNPVIYPDNVPGETEQYVPAPVQIGSDVWCYVKRSHAIDAWRSVDGGYSFTHENGGNPVLTGSPGLWDAARVLNPTAILTPNGSTIQLIYKGSPTQSGPWSIGYAEASVFDPTTFVKQGVIITDQDISFAFGVNSINNSADSVVFHNGQYHLWGWFHDPSYTADGGATGLSGTFLATGPTLGAMTITPGLIERGNRGNYSTLDHPGIDPGSRIWSWYHQQPEVFRLPSGEWAMVSNRFTFATGGSANLFRSPYWSSAPAPVGPWTWKGRFPLQPEYSGQFWDGYAVYAIGVLKDCFGHVLVEDGRIKVYYSGSVDGVTTSRTGLYLLDPEVLR